MRMKRLMVAPFYFGTSDSEYQFEGGPVGSTQWNAHVDVCLKYTLDWSVRLWEPGRNALSMPGIRDIGNDLERGPEIPVVATIHGVKGDVTFHLGCTDADLGLWYDDEGVPLAPQPSAEATWLALGSWPGHQLVNNTNTGLQAFLEDAEVMRLFASQRSILRMPLFVALYRGTYKYIDADAGAEIDSGPADDAATLLSMDISNPSVLESARIDWWDHDWLTFPTATWHRSNQHSYSAGGGWANVSAGGQGVTNEARGGFHRYAINLDANKTLGPDQVLWLHFRTGNVRMPVIWQRDTVTTLTCATYAKHKFATSIHASMLVSTRVSA